LKDLPNELHESLEIRATPPRGDARDVLVSRSGDDLSHLPASARIGTSSIRRKAQLLGLRRDLEVREIHGNVESRVRKLSEFGIDGVVLAAAGLQRTGLGGRISQFFRADEVVPAVGQGTIAVEVRKDDRYTGGLVSRISDRRAWLSALCERAFSSALGGDCYIPIGAYAEVRDDNLEATGVVVSPDGSSVAKRTIGGEAKNPEELGRRLATALLDSGGIEILEATRR